MGNIYNTSSSRSSASASASGGVGFLGLLTIAFIVLKLIGIITWSWWWELSPIWITPAIIIVVAIIAFLFFAFRK